MVDMSTVKKESLQVSAYSRRLKDNMKSILDNYAEILKAAKVSCISLWPRINLLLKFLLTIYGYFTLYTSGNWC